MIANRGEIASRIIRTCRKMGIRSIAVYSDADRELPYVAEADLALGLGEPAPSASYLNQDKLFALAKAHGVDAIHPGYGFLSENAGFAKRCAEEGICFVGPNPQAIQAMGSKSSAKALMEEHGVPTIPGYRGEDQSLDRLTTEALQIGFPLLLKASAGGGGKGMRIVDEESKLSDAIAAAKREANNAFGDDELIIEKYIAKGRHIEFQIFGDKLGNAIHVLERECTIQRRYQKVVEESPSPIMSEELRAEMGASAVAAAKALNYDNAGTVEFIYDDLTGDYYFLEVNTRLQVEHPVTEEITGLDLVELQIQVAQALPLGIAQDDVVGNGYAVEVRLYAEDASNDFMPVSGTIQRFELPEVAGLRVESAIEAGSTISVYYDPMIAKLIVHDVNRASALRKMRYVLQQMRCLGMTTNQDFLVHLFQQDDFLAGQYDTHYIAEKINLSDISASSNADQALASIAACLYAWQKRQAKRSVLAGIPSGWRNNFYQHQIEKYTVGEEEMLLGYRYDKGRFNFLIGEEVYAVKLMRTTENGLSYEVNGVLRTVEVFEQEGAYTVHHASFGSIQLSKQDRLPRKHLEEEQGGYISPMPSQVIQLLVEEGEAVVKGQGLIVLSSMKMENTIYAEEAGTVAEIYVSAQQNIAAGFTLLKIE